MSASLAERRVRELMSGSVSTLAPEDTLEDADAVMAVGRLRHLPVMERGVVVGVLTERDLLRALLPRKLGLTGQPPRALLGVLTVREVMSAPAVTVSPEVTVGEAAQTMLQRRIGCLPVLEEGRLVGILTRADLLHALRH